MTSIILFQDLLCLDLVPPPQQLFSSPHYPTSSYYTTPPAVSQGVPKKSLPQTSHVLPPLSSSGFQNTNDQIYSQLQLPSASNKGSMKKRKSDSGLESFDPCITLAGTSYSSISSSTNYKEREYYDNDVKVWAVEYGPEVFSLRKKTVKV